MVVMEKSCCECVSPTIDGLGRHGLFVGVKVAWFMFANIASRVLGCAF